VTRSQSDPLRDQRIRTREQQIAQFRRQQALSGPSITSSTAESPLSSAIDAGDSLPRAAYPTKGDPTDG